MSYGQYKKHQNELPYSVQHSYKGSAADYNEIVELKSSIKRIEARSRAISALAQVNMNLEGLRQGTWSPPVFKFTPIPKPSVISRIYNWFLNIQY